MTSSTFDFAMPSPGTCALESVLECVVCLETFTDPRMLPCQHTVCLPCLERIIKAPSVGKSCREDFQCPTCRRDYQVPENGAQSFPKNLLALSLIDSMTSSPRATRTGQPEAMLSDSPEGAASDGEYEECQAHSNQSIKYYCNTCEVAGCSECCLEKEHRGHDVCGLETAAARVTKRFEDGLISAAEKLSTLYKATHSLHRRKLETEHQLTLAKTEVMLVTESLCQNARKQESQLLGMIDQMGKVALDKITTSLRQCEDRVASTEQLYATVESTDPRYKITESQNLLRVLDETLQEDYAVPDVTCEVRVNNSGEISRDKLIGEAKLTDDGVKTPVKPKPISEGIFPSDSSPKFYLGCKQDVTGMALLSGMFYLTHRHDSSLWVYTGEGHLSTKMSIPNMTSPSGLAVYERDRPKLFLAIPDTATLRSSPKPPCRLHLLGLAADQAVVAHDVQRLDYIPRKITITRDRDLVIAAETKCVVHDSNGSIKHVVPFPEGVGPGVHVFRSQKSQYVVLEPSKITWLNSGGQVMHTCANQNLTRVVHSLDDTSGQLLVVTQGKRKIHLLSGNGEYKKCLLKDPCGVGKPLCICLEEDKSQLFIVHQTKSGQAVNKYDYGSCQTARYDPKGIHFGIDIHLNDVIQQ